MEQPKYGQKPSIPAIEVSTSPSNVDIAISTSTKEANPLPPGNVGPDGNEAVTVDQEQDGTDGPVRSIADPAVEPAPPVVLPERK